ncbi:putative hydro-lyase [Crassaminicella profunda]|uniref:putative hydro-lyase n=1 Tax=Crassaminicella profunda TaxID=1286698 RepID=UPI001CA7A254|nr:putative hydro-lyase [Crassaminicella profunda]QZY54191.1 putative hydro-lyase [Crassaminicella profunda]
MNDLSCAQPFEVRQMIRENKIQTHTSGMCHGYTQGNLVILPKNLAYDFLLFAQRNPKPCPILEVTDIGSTEFKTIAPGSNITTDIPKYRIYKKGELQGEYTHIKDFWRNDFVSFMLGCSFTFESALTEEGIEIRHITNGKNVPMYITNIQCKKSGVFSGPTVVSMRPIPYEKIVKTIQITSRYPSVHGAPIHIGDPEIIGIKDINKPDFGDPVAINPGEVPIFWACGVTPQAVAMNVKPEIMITHAPGHMFITDIKNHELARG